MVLYNLEGKRVKQPVKYLAARRIQSVWRGYQGRADANLRRAYLDAREALREKSRRNIPRVTNAVNRLKVRFRTRRALRKATVENLNSMNRSLRLDQLRRIAAARKIQRIFRNPERFEVKKPINWFMYFWGDGTPKTFDEHMTTNVGDRSKRIYYNNIRTYGRDYYRIIRNSFEDKQDAMIAYFAEAKYKLQNLGKKRKRNVAYASKARSLLVGERRRLSSLRTFRRSRVPLLRHIALQMPYHKSVFKAREFFNRLGRTVAGYQGSRVRRMIDDYEINANYVREKFCNDVQFNRNDARKMLIPGRYLKMWYECKAANPQLYTLDVRPYVVANLNELKKYNPF